MKTTVFRYDVWLLIAVLDVAIGGCSNAGAGAAGRITPEYGADGKLQLLKYDSTGGGAVDTWSYMDGARVVRIEIDTDTDGRIDRWEHYGSDRNLQKTGLSRRHDGIEDSWAFTGSDGAVIRLDISMHRDGTIDRVEHYEGGIIVRAEEDTDADGRLDKWETYDKTRLTSVAFDTHRRGTPDRRLSYASDGTTSVEEDRAGDGHLLPHIRLSSPIASRK
jgi:hypothetical protein